MRLKFTGAASALLLVAQAASADISVTLTGVTDYDFRGVSQTQGDSKDSGLLVFNPAPQISIDYSRGLFYAGAWASTVDFGKSVEADAELDLYAGFAGETEGGFRWDVGGTVYLYPGSDFDENDPLDPDDDQSASEDYAEWYAGAGFGPVDVKLWYSPDLYDVGETAWYAEANAGFSLPADIGLNLHVGYSFGDAWDSFEDAARADDPEYNGDNADYYDYSLGLARSFGHFDFEVKYVGTVVDNYFQIKDGPNRNDERVILSVSTTIPWSDE